MYKKIVRQSHNFSYNLKKLVNILYYRKCIKISVFKYYINLIIKYERIDEKQRIEIYQSRIKNQ